MLLFGHLGITLGIFFGLVFFAPRLSTVIDPRFLAIGALLPDLVDKPIGRIIFASSVANGRIIGHTLLFSFLLLLIGLYLYEKRRDIKVVALATGSFFHLFEDQMWAQPRTFFWPLHGLSFPRDHTDYSGLEYLLKMFEQSFQSGFSGIHMPELMGMGILVLMTLYWLKKRLDKKGSDDLNP
jgi:LexA-binding, inner membrane-associated putative hydrolase